MAASIVARREKPFRLMLAVTALLFAACLAAMAFTPTSAWAQYAKINAGTDLYDNGVPASDYVYGSFDLSDATFSNITTSSGDGNFAFLSNAVVTSRSHATEYEVAERAVVSKDSAPAGKDKTLKGGFTLTWKGAVKDHYGQTYDLKATVTDVSFKNSSNLSFGTGGAYPACIMVGHTVEAGNTTATLKKGVTKSKATWKDVNVTFSATDLYGRSTPAVGKKASTCTVHDALPAVVKASSNFCGGSPSNRIDNLSYLRAQSFLGKDNDYNYLGVKFKMTVSVQRSDTGQTVSGGALGVAFRDLDQAGMGDGKEINYPSKPASDISKVKYIESIQIDSGFYNSEQSSDSSQATLYSNSPTTLRSYDGSGKQGVWDYGSSGATRIWGSVETGGGTSISNKRSGFTATVNAKSSSFTWSAYNAATTLFESPSKMRPRSADTLILGSKTVDNGSSAVPADTFKFGLYRVSATLQNGGSWSKAGTKAAKVTAPASGLFTFPLDAEVEDWKIGTYKYKVIEEDSDATRNGTYGKDTSEQTVTVTVTSDNKGGATAAATYDSGAAPAFNDWTPCTGTVSVAKNVSNASTAPTPDISGKYTFTIEPVTKGAPMPDAAYGPASPSAPSSSDPSSTTHTVTFDAVGGTASQPNVTVANGSGNYNDISWLKAARDGCTFDGWYDARHGGEKIWNADGSAVANGTYWDSSRNWKYSGDVTAYAHWTINKVQITNPDADGGTAAYPAIHYTEPGTYRYKITESRTSGTDAVFGMVDDSTATKYVTVTVAQGADGKLAATTAADDSAYAIDSGVSFTNSYEPPSVDLAAKKKLDESKGKARESIAGKYTFTITAETDGAPMPPKTTAVNSADDGATASFGSVTYTKPGTYVYKVTESGTVPGIENDKAASSGKKLTVIVSQDGSVKATATAEFPTFTNSVRNPVEMPDTGHGGISWQLALAALAAVAAASAYVYRRKKIEQI
jgi:pilin isopeptide linkage protein